LNLPRSAADTDMAVLAPRSLQLLVCCPAFAFVAALGWCWTCVASHSIHRLISHFLCPCCSLCRAGCGRCPSARTTAA
jgi:hypothetical protein